MNKQKKKRLPSSLRIGLVCKKQVQFLFVKNPTPNTPRFGQCYCPVSAPASEGEAETGSPNLDVGAWGLRAASPEVNPPLK